MALSSTLVQRLAALPSEPGCYLMKDEKEKIVYVGKANNLRSRVRSYFGATSDTRAFVQILEEVLGDIEVIVTRTEKEALILENRLIKEHRPRFNVQLKDDSSFLYLVLDRNRTFPRFEVTRRPRKKPGILSFGPYHSASAIRKTLHVLNRHFYLRTCPNTVFQNRSRPCLEYQIHRCPGPCVHPYPSEKYRDHLDDAVLFLQGKADALTKNVEARMLEASGDLQFERAAHYRDQLTAIESSLSRQDIEVTQITNADVVGVYREGPTVAIQVQQIREGSLIASRPYPLGNMELPTPDVLRSFLQQYYENQTLLPREVLLPVHLDSKESLESWLRDKSGHKVTLHTPQKGFKLRLVNNAIRNARQTQETHQKTKDNAIAMLSSLQHQLRLENFPGRIECMDISNIQGAESVASAVCFTDGAPDKNHYRHYRIRLPDEPNDFAMMMEVVTRRFTRGLQDGDLPDLLVIDGGKGQLSSALEALQEIGVVGVDVIGLAKSRLEDGERSEDPSHSPERVFLPGRKNPIVLRQNSAELYLLTRIRDEAHRFAITYHRKLRSKRTLTSSLDSIPGVGPGRRKALLKQFGSIKRLRAATEEEIAQVSGISPALAALISQQLTNES